MEYRGLELSHRATTTQVVRCRMVNPKGKMSYGEPPGIKLHKTVVVSGEATNREKIMYDVGGNMNVVEVQRTRKNRVAY
jgi:hypothetical protein